MAQKQKGVADAVIKARFSATKYSLRNSNS